MWPIFALGAAVIGALIYSKSSQSSGDQTTPDYSGNFGMPVSPNVGGVSAFSIQPQPQATPIGSVVDTIAPANTPATFPSGAVDAGGVSQPGVVSPVSAAVTSASGLSLTMPQTQIPQDTTPFTGQISLPANLQNHPAIAHAENHAALPHTEIQKVIPRFDDKKSHAGKVHREPAPHHETGQSHTTVVSHTNPAIIRSIPVRKPKPAVTHPVPGTTIHGSAADYFKKKKKHKPGEKIL